MVVGYGGLGEVVGVRRVAAGRAAEVPPGYEAISELGRGGLGVVVLARHQRLGRPCAIKRMLCPPGPGSEAEARFRREAQVLAALDHPSIVRLYDVAYVDGALYLVMEYVEGSDLRRLIDLGEMPTSDRVRVLADVAAALEHAAARGVVHRDVKPANVFVLPNGRAKLGDFGIARVLGDATAFRTAEGSLAGSLAYMAPEQLAGASDIGPPADVYSFCVMAHELTVGRRPDRPPLRPDAHVPGYPRAAADAIIGGLCDDPAVRPTAVQVSTALMALEPAAWPVVARAQVAQARPAVHDRPAITATEAGEPFEPLPTRTVTNVGPNATHTGVAEVGGAGLANARSTWVEVPVYQPPRSRAGRIRPRTLALAAAVVVGAVGAVVAIAALRRPSQPTVAVESVSVDIAAAARERGCPAGTFSFTGLVRTNGAAGTVEIQWTGPDGVDRPPLTLDATKGVRELRSVLEFSVSGRRELSGPASLHVLAPGAHFAVGPEIAYSCR